MRETLAKSLGLTSEAIGRRTPSALGLSTQVGLETSVTPSLCRYVKFVYSLGSLALTITKNRGLVVVALICNDTSITFRIWCANFCKVDSLDVPAFLIPSNQSLGLRASHC